MNPIERIKLYISSPEEIIITEKGQGLASPIRFYNLLNQLSKLLMVSKGHGNINLQ